MIWLLMLLWFAAALAVGLPLARRALREDGRLAVLLPFALVGGHCLQSLLLMILWGTMPLGSALHLTLAISFTVGALLWRLLRCPSPAPISWGVGPLDSIAFLSMLAFFGFLGHRVFTMAYLGSEAEALFFHSATVGWLEKTSHPPLSPLEPDDLLRYRLGLHVLAAAMGAGSGTWPPMAMAATAAMLLPLLAISFVGASLRLFNSPRPGVLASVLGLFGGSLTFWPALYQAVRFGVPLDRNEFISGILWHGNTLDMLALNITVSIGFVAFTMGLWLCWEVLRSPQPGLVTLFVALSTLTYLGFVNEVHFAVLAAGVGIVGAGRSLRARLDGQRHWWRLLAIPGAIPLVAYLLVSLRGGLAGGVSLVGDAPGSLQLVLNLDHFGSVVASPRELPPRWIPLLSAEALIDSGFWLVVVPVLLVIALRTRNLYALTGLLASVAAFAVWVLVYPRWFPAEIYRFGQASFTIYLAMLPFTLAPVWISGALARRTRPILLAESLLLAALVVPHLARAVLLITLVPMGVWVLPGTPDYEASGYLRQSPTTMRVFVPLARPEGDWYELYDARPDSPGSAMRVLLGLSAHAIPIGHGVYMNPRRYLPPYRLASSTFDPEALAALKVDWVYVLPFHLDPAQRAHLREAQERGELAPASSFGQEGTPGERLLLRVMPASR